MPTPETSTALVPATTQGNYSLRIVEAKPGGGRSELDIIVPGSGNWADWPMLARAAVLKYGYKGWDAATLPTILCAIAFADSLGLSIEQGDVYLTDGRFSVSNKARMRYGMNRGRDSIIGVKVETKPIGETPLRFEAKRQSGRLDVYEGPNLETTVTISLKGWAEPFIHRGRLSNWFNPRGSILWFTNTEYQLETTVMGHAFERVFPMGTDAEELPLIEAPTLGIAAALEPSPSPNPTNGGKTE